MVESPFVLPPFGLAVRHQNLDNQKKQEWHLKTVDEADGGSPFGEPLDGRVVQREILDTREIGRYNTIDKRTIVVSLNDRNIRFLRSNDEGRIGDVLASEGVEGRGKLRKSSGSR